MTAQPYQRISDRILDAFGEACAQGHLDIAEVLHQALELVMTRRAGPDDIERRDVPPEVLASYEQLRALRAAQGR